MNSSPRPPHLQAAAPGAPRLSATRNPLRPLPRSARSPRFARSHAFTLLEVMIALGIFFMAVFTILALVSNTLRNVRTLQEPDVDASMLAAELSITNKLGEGSESGDFGDAYRDFTWSREMQEVGTNGLFKVDFTVHHRVGRQRQRVDTTMSVLFFRPESAPAGRVGLGR